MPVKRQVALWVVIGLLLCVGAGLALLAISGEATWTVDYGPP